MLLEIVINWLNESSLNQFLISLIFTFILGFVFMIFPIVIIKIQKPRYILKIKEIIPPYKTEFANVKVHFGKVSISDLYETRVYFWNAGGKSIRARHLLKATPIRLRVPKDIQLYSIDISATAELNETLRVDKENKDYLITFDAMQKNDGVFIRVLHSKPKEKNVEFTGKLDNRIKLKEVNALKKYDKSTIDTLAVFNNKFTRMMMPGMLGLVVSFLGMYSYLNQEFLKGMMAYYPSQQRDVSMLELLLMLLMGVFMLCVCSVNTYYTALPNELILLSNNQKMYKNLYRINSKSE